jgi:hypothetical protein
VGLASTLDPPYKTTAPRAVLPSTSPVCRDRLRAAPSACRAWTLGRSRGRIASVGFWECLHNWCWPWSSKPGKASPQAPSRTAFATRLAFLLVVRLSPPASDQRGAAGPRFRLGPNPALCYALLSGTRPSAGLAPSVAFPCLCRVCGGRPHRPGRPPRFSAVSGRAAARLRRVAPWPAPAGQPGNADLGPRAYSSPTSPAYDGILRVARTIADLEGNAEIRTPHLTEAIGYRSLDRKLWAR